MNQSALLQTPLFIGGPSRSGTVMLSAMLSRHPMIHIRGETHYFDDLRPRVGDRKLSQMTPQERDRVLDYFRALAHRPYGKRGDPAQSDLPRETLLAEAAAFGDDADAVFAAFCLRDARRFGGKTPAIWGEKTPRNAFRIDDILSAFPDARIVCTVRDPRATVVSYRDWTQRKTSNARTEQDADYAAAFAEDHRRKQLSYNLVIAVAMWRAAVNAAAAARDKHGPGRVWLQRYEDVVADPQGALAALCGWIGVEFSPDMLIVRHFNSSYDASAAQGVSADPVDRWRARLSDYEVGVIQGVAGDALTRFGYAPVPTRSGLFDLPLAYAAAPFAAARAALANRGRIANLPTYVWRRVRAAIR